VEAATKELPETAEPVAVGMVPLIQRLVALELRILVEVVEVVALQMEVILARVVLAAQALSYFVTSSHKLTM